ncbi:helix-turn-helix transcriptional regulator [Lactococcus garvieae]|uniref:helix-turn-helix domain-containing protein n=1 Tax=Lactococcus garvieae TaxID=1363 RepID=UPI001F61B9BF|nr:helix-turn-helix transcriptional regulator [Lactococcus garvieae]MCI3860783.1 helix-turn-helix transcriptional regulator [Lactococcus garvieae]
MLINNFSVLLAKNQFKANSFSICTGISESTLSSFTNIANNKKDIKLSTLIKICDYLECTLSELIEYIPNDQLKEINE